MDVSKIAKKHFDETFSERYPAKHRVLLLWISPITHAVEHRSGAFDEYANATEYAHYLKEKYLSSPFDMPFIIYIDGGLFYENRTEEVLYDGGK